MPKKTTKLSSVAYEELKAEISGLPSGHYLSLRQYAKALGISYTPVREAFLRLQAEGLLKQVPNVGFFVSPIDITDVLQIFQTRECIEIFTLEKVGDLLREEHFQKMEDAISMGMEAVKTKDTYRAVLADEAFHRVPLELLGNTSLLNLYDNIRSKYLLCSSKINTSDPAMGLPSHQEILKLLKAKESKKAVNALKKHILASKQKLVDSYINRDF